MASKKKKTSKKKTIAKKKTTKKKPKRKIKVTKGILEEMKTWEKLLTDVTLDDLKAQLREIASNPSLNHLDGADWGKAAFKQLRARIAAKLDSRASPFEALVCDIMKPKKITNRNKEEQMMAGMKLIILPGEGFDNPPTTDPMYQSIMLFDEDTEIVNKLKRGKGYSMNLKAKWENGAWAGVGATKDTIGLKEIDAEFPDLKDILENQYNIIEISEVEFNISKNRDDFKLIEGNIIFADTPQTKDRTGRYGLMTLIDDSMDLEDIKAKGGLRVYCDAHQIKWDVGSDVEALVKISKNKEGRLSVNAEVIIPIIPIPRATTFEEEEEEELEEEEDDDEEEDEEEETGDEDEEEEEEEEDEEEEVDMDGLD